MMIPGPAWAKDFRSWRADLQHWRRESLIRLGYDGSQYEPPDLKWMQRSFIQPRMTIHDLDPVAGKHTVDRYLYDLDKRLGL
jgi:hypothetical protein